MTHDDFLNLPMKITRRGCWSYRSFSSKMRLGCGIVFFIISIILVLHTESKSGSKLSVTNRQQPRLLYARYSKSKTTRSYSRRTTTYRPRTTRRPYPITTTPRPRKTTTTRRPTTTRHIITTTPWTTRRTTTRTHTTFRTTRQPPYNPFFNNSARLTTTSARPNFITTQHFIPVGQGIGNGSRTTRQPAYNPFFNNSARVTTTTARPNLITTQHSRPVGQGIGNGSRTTRQPAYNPFFNNSARVTTTTARPNLITTQHFRPVGQGIGNGSRTTKQPAYNPFFSTTKKPHLGAGTLSNIGFVIPKRNQSSTYHPPGNAFNHSKITQRPIYSNNSHGITNHQRYPVYPINPAPSVQTNNGHYQPGRGYQPSDQFQQQQPPRVTIVNNNINTQVIYPPVHWNSYGPPASGITIINNNNNNYGYHNSRPTYHYSSSDTGSSDLGFYLGYRLGKLTRPSYHYHGTYYENNAYVPRYDHYVIHHYYHERESIPKEAEIPNNIIVTCAGDSGSICPSNTFPLCMNNAAVMCVTNALSTDTCEHDANFKCVKSSVPCMNSNTKDCQGKSNVSVSIPCISTAKIQGIPTIINNTLSIDKGVANESSQPLCVTVLASPSLSKNVTSEKTVEQINMPFHYTTNDTGADSLGIYLGQILEKLEYPSYVFLNYDGNMKYSAKFDHFNVYHYHHGGNILLNETEVNPNSTISCVGDSGMICPQNSSSLCFSDGGVACLTDISSTVYNNDTKTRLVLTTIPCTESKDPACQGNNSTMPLLLPCMSIAKIYSNTSYLINNVTSANGTVRFYKTINILSNLTSTLSMPREFCVTILLLPGEKSLRLAPKIRRVSGIKNSKKYSSLPKYSYSTKLSEDKTLGYYLVRRLDMMWYPSFYFMNELVQEQDGKIQLYDHLSVHHFYDGKEIIPEYMDLHSSSMVVCQGDSGIVCPANTSVICLNDGGIMCVTDLLLTESCSKGTYCVKSKVPCENLKAPKCRRVARVLITMPCISILTVFGDIMSVDNSVYKMDKNKAISYVDLQPVPKTDGNNSQLFCVSIILLPEKRVVTEGEKIIDATKSIFGNFAIKLFGIS